MNPSWLLLLIVLSSVTVSPADPLILVSSPPTNLDSSTSTFKLGFASWFSNQTASMVIIQLTYESDAFDYVHLDASMNGVNVTSSAKVTVDPGSLLIVWNPLNPTNGLLNATLCLQGKKEGVQRELAVHLDRPAKATLPTDFTG